MREIIVGRDIAEMNRLAAERFVIISEESIQKRGRFTVALSGGSTPKALYKLLASEPYRSQVDWTHVLFFFGDERNVTADSEESNYRMANEYLFEPLSISNNKVFCWRTELGVPEAAANEYAKTLRSQFGATDIPVFDLILLGMGQDGHTASLFPHTSALDDTEHLAVSNTVPKLETTRLTFTYPVINAAHNIAFLIAGADKAKVLAEVLEGNGDRHALPSKGVHPMAGKLFWFVDAAAATDLTL